MTKCSMCGGKLTCLGQLGLRVHYRCRDCGWDQSELEEVEES